MLILRRHFVTGIVGATGAVALGESACTPAPPVTDVIYQGGATEAGVIALLEAPLLSDPNEAASFTWTSNGDSFSASQPLTFCWTSVVGPGAPGLKPAAKLTGKAYLFVLSTEKNPKLVRVFTTNSDFAADATIMTKLANAGGRIQAIVTTGFFTEDDIAKGPFTGNGVTFTLTP